MQPMSEVEQQIRKEAFDETCDDILPMLRSIASKFQKRFSGDFDDYFSEVQEIFIDLYLSDEYDPKRGMTFSSWLYYKVWYKLIDKHKVAWRRKREELTDDLAERRPFPMMEWLESLPADAAILVRLVLDYPKCPCDEADAYMEALQGLSEGKNPDEGGKFVRRWCRRLLMDQGWCGARINKAFKALKNSLT